MKQRSETMYETINAKLHSIDTGHSPIMHTFIYVCIDFNIKIRTQINIHKDIDINMLVLIFLLVVSISILISY